MELDDSAVNNLVGLGLSRYEARVYLALVRRDSYTAAQAARAADVPVSGCTTYSTRWCAGT